MFMETKEFIKKLPEYFDDPLHAFRFSGASMDDGSSASICDGDVIYALKEDPEVLINDLKEGSIYSTYVIFIETGSTCRQVIDFDETKNSITCHPLNPDLKDEQIELKDIQELYRISEMHRDMPSDDLFNKE